MRVLRLIRPRQFRWDQEPEPCPGPGEVLIAVQAVGVCASDIHTYARGQLGTTLLESPLVLGHEASGVIRGLGPGVQGLQAGQPVAIDPAIPCGTCERCLEGNPNLCETLKFLGTWPFDGALRECLVHPANLVHPLDKELSAADGAMLEPLGVALHSADLAHLSPGCSVSVHGCGPIGLLVIEAARLAGAAQVIALEPIANRRDMAKRMGADHAIETDGNQLECVRSLAQGGGVDVAFEAAGENNAVEDAMEVVRPGGRVVLIGIPPDDVTSFRASTARRKGLTILLCRRMKYAYHRAMALAERRQVDLRSWVTHQIPFRETPNAFDLVERRADGVIKAIVILGEQGP